jgi:integrase
MEATVGYAEPRGKGKSAYWRARYKISPGHYGTLQDEHGSVIKYPTRAVAKKAADARESQDAAKPRTAAVAPETVTFGRWASIWYSRLDLAPSTMANYERHLVDHLLPAFEAMLLNRPPDDPDATQAVLDQDAIDAWVKKEAAAGYKPGSVRTWRATLHAVLAAAVDRKPPLITSNPATRRRGTGKRSGRPGSRGPEKAITGPLGALLIGERASILSGRDDEFTGVQVSFWTAMRWAEVVGLELPYFREETIRVEQQLYELPEELVQCPPKDGSYRTVDVPPFLSALISGHIARTSPQPCPCHGMTCVFTAHGRARGARNLVSLRDVAGAARVSAATVSNVLNDDARVTAATAARVREAIAELGFARSAAPAEHAPHWRRSGFGAWIFVPAASGWFPAKAPQPRRPVPVSGDPWPGVPVRGRGNAARADACWVPIAPGLTEHGLRHGAKTVMVELRTPEILSHQRLGHDLGGIAGVYSHVTASMRAELMDQLSGLWLAALDARLAMCPRSPVKVLDDLLQARQQEIFSRDSPRGEVVQLRLRA